MHLIYRTIKHKIIFIVCVYIYLSLNCFPVFFPVMFIMKFTDTAITRQQSDFSSQCRSVDCVLRRSLDHSFFVLHPVFTTSALTVWQCIVTCMLQKAPSIYSSEFQNNCWVLFIFMYLC